MIGQVTDSSLFSSTVEELKKNKRLREEGKHISIPYGFPKLDKVYPGIMKASYTLISCNSKVGKTQIANYLYIYNPLEFLQTHETNLDVKIVSFNLEMSKEALMRQTIAYRLFQKGGVKLNTRNLQSLFRDYILSNEILRFIEEDREWFDYFESKVTFVDHIRNPYGIYKYMRQIAIDNGTFFKDGEQVDMSQDKASWDTYVENNPDLIIIPIVDNLNLLLPEKDDNGKQQDLKAAISNYSSNYCITMRNKLYMSPVNIQQQAMGNESIDGKKMDMQEPSAANLADWKATAKDANTLITMHSPFRAKQAIYPVNNGYDIRGVFKDNFRQFNIQFDREGQSVETSLYFDGAINLFEELPSVGTPELDNFIKTTLK